MINVEDNAKRGRMSGVDIQQNCVIMLSNVHNGQVSMTNEEKERQARYNLEINRKAVSKRLYGKQSIRVKWLDIIIASPWWLDA